MSDSLSKINKSIMPNYSEQDGAVLYVRHVVCVHNGTI